MNTVQVSGLADLQKKLRLLGDEAEEKIMRTALAATARTLRDSVRQNFQADWKPESQTVLRNIVAAKRKTKFKSRSRYVVRVRDGRKAKPKPEKIKGPRGGTVYVNDPFYWRFLEFGFTDPHGNYHQGSGFIRRSFQEEKTDLIDKFKTVASRNLKRYVDRVGKQ